MPVLQHLADALRLAFTMFWDVLWPLGLGFLLSAVVQTFVSRTAITRLLGTDSRAAVARAAAFGAASSSCSYAAVALARSLFRKGATLSNAIIFEFASTNLVFELGLALVVLLGWQFFTAEIGGGVVMVVLLAVIFRATLRPRLVDEARRTASMGRAGRMEGHAAMDMSISGGPLFRRVLSGRAYTAVAHCFVMDVYSVWTDLLIGFLLAGALGAWVPDGAWSALFLSGHGAAAFVWGALIGPLIAMLSFVCSVGNVPLAAVLWRGGISFGGVVAFIFGDLIILPILDIYRRYYGRRVAVYLLGVSYATMVLAGLAVGALFQAVGAAPSNRTVSVFNDSIGLNVTTVLDAVALALAAVLGLRFLRTGGPQMLRMMDASAEP
ncbi:MAG: permease [Candidatus Dormibacteraeota bacterium]|nr:permease [Candidatus Dormibacteraeota bacterium]MBV9524829.1 permease [Candidatus Dormibacteraeota bacterium]